MRRKLVWVERPDFQGWACSECAWVFSPAWPLVGNTIDEMKTKFGEERDKEFDVACLRRTPESQKRFSIARLFTIGMSCFETFEGPAEAI